MNTKRNLLILKPIIFLLIFFLSLPVLANNNNIFKRYYFEQFTSKEGPFDYNLDCITQDDEGYIYTCSQNGLHIFNGHSFKAINLDTHPDFSNKVYSVLDIGQGKILVGTLDEGLYIYDKQREKIIKPKLELKEADFTLSIRYLYMDSNKTIWAGCSNGMLLLFARDELLNTSDNQSVKYQIIKTNEHSNVNTICQWKNSIFFGTDDPGLYSVDLQMPFHTSAKAIKLENSHSQIISLHVNNDRLWVGTNSGIVILEKDSAREELTTCSYELPNNVIKSIDSNSPDNIWVGTLENGLFNILFNRTGSQIQQYKYNPQQRKSINSNSILSIFIDKQSNLWIGTWFGGLNRIKLSDPAFTTIFNSENENELQKNITWCITPSKKGGYWIGTHANGLNYYNTGNGFKPVKLNEHLHSVSSILELDAGKLLFVGTWGNGIKVLDTQNLTEITEFDLLFDRIKKDRIYSMIQDNNTIWIGTYYNGLFRFNMKNRILDQIQFNPTENSLSENTTDVRSIYLEGQNMWIGSIHKGLFKLEIDKGGNVINSKKISFQSESSADLRVTSILHYDDKITCTTEDGVFQVSENDSIYRILPGTKGIICMYAQSDDSSNLWISTYKGLFRYSHSNKQISIFYKDVDFYQSLYNKAKKEMLVCSISGLYQFDPETVSQQKEIPKIAIAGLRIFDNPILPGYKLRGKTILNKNPNYIETLVLPYFCNAFSFDIKTLDLASNTNNTILYQMEGVDLEWHSRNESETNISYTNIPAGKYTFKVKVGGTISSKESETKILKIIKLKPWWFSNLAFIGYFLVALLIIYFIFREIRIRVNIKNELKIGRLNKEKEEELHQQKLTFFTNISHELRTPLTLMVSPLEELMNKNSSNPLLLPTLNTIHKNTLLLQRLINQILDFRKIERASVEIDLHKINVPYFLREIIQQFKEIANKKNIEIEIESDPEEIWWPIDPYKFESIVYNLVSNSLKFTKKYGRIFIQIKKLNDSIEFQFQDTGIGIEATDIPKIFERFYQSKQITQQQGTGIGLALVKKYVEIHNGSINVDSIKGSGTTFSITFNHFNGININDLPTYIALETPRYQSSSYSEINDEKSKKQKRSILIVDDNADILTYIEELLKEQYTVHSAENGTEALELAKRKNPDLILSDIMMEGMDGYELCKAIKQNLGTSHIPVILLTAKKGVEPRIKGIETGADAYIEKPFNVKLLLTQISELIKHRDKLKTRYSSMDSGLKDISPTSVDEKFLQEVIAVIDSDIQNPQLTVNTISDNLKISHDQLYRKIKSLSGLSANQFIRLTRLKKAVAILKGRAFSVSEVGYQVGFNSPSYFTKCFKDEFGVSPTEFVEQLE